MQCFLILMSNHSRCHYQTHFERYALCPSSVNPSSKVFVVLLNIGRHIFHTLLLGPRAVVCTNSLFETGPWDHDNARKFAIRNVHKGMPNSFLLCFDGLRLMLHKCRMHLQPEYQNLCVEKSSPCLQYHVQSSKYSDLKRED